MNRDEFDQFVVDEAKKYGYKPSAEELPGAVGGGIVIVGQDPDAWVRRVDALLDADEAAEQRDIA